MCICIHMPGAGPSTLRTSAAQCERYWASVFTPQRAPQHGRAGDFLFGKQLVLGTGHQPVLGTDTVDTSIQGLLPPGRQVAAEGRARCCLPSCLVWSVWGLAALTFNSSQRTRSRASSWLSSVGRRWAGPWGTRHTGAAVTEQEATPSHPHVTMNSSGCHADVPACVLVQGHTAGRCRRSQHSVVVRTWDEGPGLG